MWSLCRIAATSTGAYAACKQVFGLIAIARAVPCEKSKEAILETAKAYLGDSLRRCRQLQGGE